MVKRCRRCLYTSAHPLGLEFNDQEVCTGCLIHEEKDQIDWVERLSELKDLVEPYRNRNGTQWDCIVPVSGGRDSFFIVHTVKNVLGLNPLLVTYNRHYNTRAGIENIQTLRTQLACDILTQTLNPKTILRIMQASLEKCGSLHWHAIAGQTVFPVWTAYRHRIPLIIWGHHQGLDQVGMFSHHDRVEMTKRYRTEHDLMQVAPEDLIGSGDSMKEEELHPFMYPSDAMLMDRGIRGIYLGNYMRWDSLAQHRAMKNRYGYFTGGLPRTFDRCNDIDCELFTGLHDVIKYRKWGYTKLTDDLCREIRFGRITVERAESMLSAIEPDTATLESQFVKQLELSPKSFDELIDRHRSTQVWDRAPRGCWRLAESLRPQTSSQLTFDELKSLNPTDSTLDDAFEHRMLTQGQGERL